VLSYFIVLAIWLGYEYISLRRQGVTFREIKGVTKWLLLGPAPTPECRACGVKLPDQWLRIEVGHGAYICEDCEKDVEKDLQAMLPEWYTKPLPAEKAEHHFADCIKVEGDKPCTECTEYALDAVGAPKRDTYVCSSCGETHFIEHICMVELEKVMDPPGDQGDWFEYCLDCGASYPCNCEPCNMGPPERTVVVSGQLAVKEPRMNVVIKSEDCLTDDCDCRRETD
jgi:ribosomal protein L32